MEALQYLWNDRKRIFGMPISFTKYSLTDDRIFLERGVLTLSSDELLLYRVRDLSLRMTLWQRIFHVGTVVVNSSDQSNPKIELTNIRQPREVKELIHKQVEAMKIARRMRVGELIDDDVFENSASSNN